MPLCGMTTDITERKRAEENSPSQRSTAPFCHQQRHRRHLCQAGGRALPHGQFSL